MISCKKSYYFMRLKIKLKLNIYIDFQCVPIIILYTHNEIKYLPNFQRTHILLLFLYIKSFTLKIICDFHFNHKSNRILHISPKLLWRFSGLYVAYIVMCPKCCQFFFTLSPHETKRFAQFP